MVCVTIQAMKRRKGILTGTLLILIGVIFVLRNYFGIEVLQNLKWVYIWPLLLIYFGATMIIKKW